MTLLLLYLGLAIAVSFFCSIMEAVLLSVTPSYIALLEERRPISGRLLRGLKHDIDRPLAAILSLNTIAHTVGAAGVGAQAQKVFGGAYLGVVSAVLTFLILVLSEIIPKTLGATYWRALAGFAAHSLRAMIVLMFPLVALSRLITEALSRRKRHAPFSREEFSAQVDIGTRAGIFEEKESRILKNLIRFRSLRARDIMTPRTVMVSFHEDTRVGEVITKGEQLRVSRIPVYGDNPDDMSGYVLKNDLLLSVARDQPDRALKEFKRGILILPDSLSLMLLFERLVERQEHIAVLIDEYGGLAGIVTMEDVVETLIGMEIVDEVDNIRDMQAMARERWKQRASRLGLVEQK